MRRSATWCANAPPPSNLNTLSPISSRRIGSRSSPRSSRGEGSGEWCFRVNGERWTRGWPPHPIALRSTSPRIRLRQKAGFGGQERGEVNRAYRTKLNRPAITSLRLRATGLRGRHQRAAALVQRAEGLIAGHGLDDLGVIPRPLRFLGRLDLQQIH